MGGFFFSSSALPEKNRARESRDLLAEHMMIDITPFGTPNLDFQISCRQLEGMSLVRFAASTIRMSRDRGMSAKLDDDLELSVMMGGSARGTISRLGDYSYRAGQSMIHSSTSPGTFVAVNPTISMLKFPRLWAEAAGLDLGAYASLPKTAELSYLGQYLAFLTTQDQDISPSVASSLSTHLADLCLLSLGATGDFADIARRRGLKAARMAAIKAFIRKHLADGRISLDDVALYQKISPRYVRALFEEEGTSFSDYVLEQRLVSAAEKLTTKCDGQTSITAVAYACGFNDLSYFNRVFKRRFAMTPRDMRKHGNTF